MSYARPKADHSRLIGLALVVLLHLALGYALVKGLAHKLVEVVHSQLETRIFEVAIPPPIEKPPPPPPAPPPAVAPPKQVAPPPFVPPPEIRVDTPPPAEQTIRAVTPIKAPEEAPIRAPVVSAAPVRTTAKVEVRSCAKPDYPAQSLRNEEEGLVVVQFLIATDGNSIESKVEKSSGFRRLDEAARQALSLCKFKPGTEDGKPVQSWARIEYLWRMEK